MADDNYKIKAPLICAGYSSFEWDILGRPLYSLDNPLAWVELDELTMLGIPKHARRLERKFENE